MVVKNKMLRITVLTIFILATILTWVLISDSGYASAATYPKYIKESSEYIVQHVWLTKKYEFISYTVPYAYTDNSAYIYKHEDGQIYTMVSWKSNDGSMVEFVGKCDDKYYFNKRGIVETDKVITYKLGKKKFRSLKNTKEVNFIPFKKSKDYIFCKGGLSKNRYVLGIKGYPTDAGSPYYVVVYDLKKHTKKILGEAFDVARDDGKLFWVKCSNYPYNKKTKLIIKTSDLSGGNRKVYKRYKAGFLKDSYGRGEINKHYVKYRYLKMDKNGNSKTYLFKRKYRN